MDNLIAVLKIVVQDCYLASIDLADVKAQFLYWAWIKKYLLLQFEGNLYKCKCFPNGLI